jgi:hypothetical protein
MEIFDDVLRFLPAFIFSAKVRIEIVVNIFIKCDNPPFNVQWHISGSFLYFSLCVYSFGISKRVAGMLHLTLASERIGDIVGFIAVGVATLCTLFVLHAEEVITF